MAAKKQINEYLNMKKLKKIAHYLIVAWFTTSFAALCIYDPTPKQAIIVISNFGLASIAISLFPIKKELDEA